MILVPRQLQRSGMTGGVPYYGGRLTPAQAWGASHSRTPQAPAREPESAASALESLRESGVLTAEEYDELRGRIHR
jgi:hypothetical protein